jgi:hypothetical protein
MTRPNITPGPWHVSSLEQIWDETGDIKIAEICELPRIYIAGSMRPNLEQETANARAIAALPALLSALETIQANAAESPEWIRRHTMKALTAAGYQF